VSTLRRRLPAPRAPVPTVRRARGYVSDTILIRVLAYFGELQHGQERWMRHVAVRDTPRPGMTIRTRDGFVLHVKAVELTECDGKGPGPRDPDIDVFCERQKDLERVKASGLWTKLEDAAS